MSAGTYWPRTGSNRHEENWPSSFISTRSLRSFSSTETLDSVWLSTRTGGPMQVLQYLLRNVVQRLSSPWQKSRGPRAGVFGLAARNEERAPRLETEAAGAVFAS